MDLRANAIITAVDHFSRPVQAMAGALRAFGTVGGGGRMAAMGRGLDRLGSSLTNLATLGAGFGAMGLARGIFDTSMNFERASNRVTAFGELTASEVADLRLQARALGKELPYNATEALKLAEDLYKAGFSHKQTVGMLRESMRLMAASGDDVDAEKAAEIATGIMFGMQLPMATTEETARSMAQVVDRLTYAANKSVTDVRELGVAFKYAAPFASQLGLGLDDLSAGFMTMAQSNIRADEAGVAFRSMLVRMLKPTQGMLQTLGRLGINLGDFVTQAKDLNLGALVNSFEAAGVTLSKGGQAKLKGLLKDKELLKDGAKLHKALLDAIVADVGDGSVQDSERIAAIFNDAFLSAANNVDLRGFLQALKDKGAQVGDIARIFDSRQGSRIATLLVGSLYDSFLDKLKDEADGYSYKVVDTMMQGAYGSFKRFQASWHNLQISLGESGVLDDMVAGMNKLREAFEWIGQLDPEVRRFGTWAAMAAAALPLLGFAAIGLSAAMSMLSAALTPAGLAIGALAYLGYELIANWDSVKAYFEEWWAWFENGWNSLVDRFQNLLARLSAAKDALGGGEFSKAAGLLSGSVPIETAHSARSELSRTFRDAITPSLGAGWGMIRELDPAAGPANVAPIKVESEVKGTLNGKVTGEMDVRIKVEGPGKVVDQTGGALSGAATGNLDTGKSMPDTSGP